MRRKIAIIFLFVLLMIFFTGCESGSLSLKDDMGLLSIRNKKEYEELLNTNYNKESIFFRNKDTATDYFEEPTANEDYTTTNVQVEGVDEIDVVKTNGDYIYYVSQSAFKVVKVLASGEVENIYTESINKQSIGLYITNKYIVVIENTFTTENSVTIDIYDINTIEKVKKIEIGGFYSQSRLYKDNLYIISYKNYHGGLPWYNDKEKEVMSYQDIKYLEGTLYNTFSTITTIKLNDDIQTSYDTLLASHWDVIYVNTNGIYFVTSTYMEEWVVPYLSIANKQVSKIINYMFNEDGDVVYGGVGEFNGYVLNQFAIDEYDGYLRIAATVRNSNSVENSIHVFKREIKDEKYVFTEVGLLNEGLGKPGELIKSVRFNGPLATVVTFVNTDPFYTIDLQDPTNPKIVGSYEVSGYSGYQLPWNEGYVLGIGYEIDEKTLMTTGMKLAIYDITDVTNPEILGEAYVIEKINSIYAINNHNALFVDKENSLFGFAAGSTYYLFAVDLHSSKPISIVKISIIVDDYYSRLVRIGAYCYLLDAGEIKNFYVIS